MRAIFLSFNLLCFAFSAMAGTEPSTTAPGAPPPAATLLRYDAFVGGAKVGEAQVHVIIDEGSYRIEGSARTRGLLDTFSNWRNRFSARGGLNSARGGLDSARGGKGEAPGGVGDQGIRPLSFSYLEKDRDRRREVLVQEGTLRVVKNGKVRPSRPAPAGFDVLTGLFVLPSCAGDQLLHTGRHHYRLTRLESKPGRCRYVVMDDDNDRYEVSVAFTNRGGVVVPHRVVVDGFLSGTVVLRDAEVAVGERINAPGLLAGAAAASGPGVGPAVAMTP